MRLALATAAVLLALAAPATAAPVWKLGSLDDGPYATPDGVAWAVGTDHHSEGEMDRTDRHTETLYVARPGGTPSAVSFGASIRTPTFSETTEDAFVAGDYAVKLTTTRGGVPGVTETSSQSAKVYDLADRRPVAHVCGFHAAGGSVLVYERCGVGAVVRDTATDAEFKAPVSAGVVAVAGRYLATRAADGRVRVFDWQAGTEVYSAALPAGVIALAPDGTVIANADLSACDVNHLVRASVADPAPRTLPLPACSGWLAISGDRLVVAARTSYVAAALDGSRPNAVAFPRYERGRAQVNGDGLAYAVATCDGGVALYRASLSEPEDEPAIDARCPGTVTRARLTARHLRVSVRCPDGCRGTLRVRSLAARKITVAGATKTYRLRVGPHTHRRLARASRVAVTLTTTALDDTRSAVTRTLRLR